MNYVDRYVDFYSGPNKKIIYRMIDGFAQAVRTGQLDVLDDMLSNDCVASISMIKKGIRGIEEIKKALTWPGEQMDIRKFNIFDYVCRYAGNQAQVYFYNQCIVAKDDGVNVFPFVFGGQFCIHLIKKEEEWRMDSIKYDLSYDYGNTCFVRGKWKLMNYNQFYGHTPMISHMSDSPWVRIPVDEEAGSEEEIAYQERYRSCYAMDAASVDELAALSVNGGSTKQRGPSLGVRKSVTKGGGTQDTGTAFEAADYLNFQKEKIHKEARLQHVMVVNDIYREGDLRTTATYRSEYNRLYNRHYTRDNIHSIVFTVYQPSVEIFEDGKWYPYQNGFKGGVIFVPVDDDCIQFDTYICGGKQWLKEA